MEIVIVPSDVATQLAADGLAALFREVPQPVVGLATGSTPEALYGELSARRARGALAPLTGLTAFALDEYVGLDLAHPQSYHSVIAREWTAPLGLDPSQVHVPALFGSLRESADDYEQAIRAAGGIDVQLLGIGANGHIGFNEPGSSLASRTRVKTLSEQTRSDNARFFDSAEEVPTHCITQGLGTILEARRILLMAFGEAKSRAVAAAVEGAVTASVPGSVLQLHPDVTVLVDDAAAAELADAAEYRHAWASRLGGQSLDLVPT